MSRAASFDLIGKVHIDAPIAALLLQAGGRDKLEKVRNCFAQNPDVLDWIGALAGIGQSPIEAGVSTEVNIGKQTLFLQVLAMIAAADLTDDQARKLLNV